MSADDSALRSATHDLCEVAVLEKAVQVRPMDSDRVLRLEAGQPLRFDRT